MSWNRLLGQEVAVGLLSQALSAGRLPHALLFTGPEGVGKRLAAEILACALFCEEPSSRPAGGCGNCRGCRLAGRLDHPDSLDGDRLEVKVSDRIERAGDMRELTMDYIEQIRQYAYRKALEGGNKLFVLERVERLNLEASAKFLKLLEEPPARTYLVLLTAHPRDLSLTIRSRVARVPFRPLRRELVARLLVERGACDRQQAELVAAAAEGRPGKALEMAVGDYRERWQAATAFWEALRGGGSRAAAAQFRGRAQQLAGAVGERESVSGREAVRLAAVAFLGDVRRVLREAAWRTLGAVEAPAAGRQPQDEITQLAALLDRESALLAFQDLARAEQAIQGNVKLELAARVLSLRLASRFRAPRASPA